MLKLLSIIIPSYNMEAYLPRCLDSLVVGAEQMQWLDVMIVNDGSNDSTSAIAHTYEEKYPDSFRVIDKQNGHYGSCINAALKVAKGKYIRVLDADDYFDNKEFSRYLDALNGIDAEVVVTDFNQVDSQGNVFYKSVNMNLVHGQVVTIENNTVGLLMMHGLTYKTDLLRRINYKQTEGILYTDSEWSFIPLLDAKTICYFHFKVYQYMLGREGQSMSKELEQKKMSHRVTVLRNMFHAYLHNQGSPMKNNARMTLRNYIITIFMLVFVQERVDEQNLQLIKGFDEELKTSCPDLYNDVGEYYITVFGWKYRVIDRWRKNKLMNVTLLHQLIRLDNAYLAIRYKVKTLFRQRKS